MLPQKSEIFERALNDPWLSCSKFGCLNREDWIWIWGKSLEKAFETSICKSSLDKNRTDTFILMFKLLNLDTQISLWSLHRLSTLFGYLIRIIDKLFFFLLLLDCATSEGVTKLFLSYLLILFFYCYVAGQEFCVVDLFIDLLAKSCLDNRKSFRYCCWSHYFLDLNKNYYHAAPN